MIIAWTGGGAWGVIEAPSTEEALALARRECRAAGECPDCLPPEGRGPCPEDGAHFGLEVVGEVRA